MAAQVVINSAVEGPTDEAVVNILIEFVGASPGPVYGKEGKARLLDRVSGYNRAARYTAWFVLVDLDRDGDCAPPIRAAWLPTTEDRLCFRVAVRALEAWLLADVEAISKFLGVSRRKLPTDADALTHPQAVHGEPCTHGPKQRRSARHGATSGQWP